MVGSPDTRLVVLRGNSASGKSTIAQGLRDQLGRGIAWIEQDYLRRTVLREHDQPGLPNIGLIDTTIRYTLDAGYHVIADGIFGAARYGDMLRQLTEDHRGVTRHYYFDIPLAETQRRHNTKPFTVPAEKLADWYHQRDLLGLNDESVITVDETPDQIIQRLIHEIGFIDPPIRAKLGAEAHLT
ncbi:AAA family ATPase [Microlunatus endophyticus]|nr:AAA family ATPase [Microlunatus endophyticus]